jgi:exopolyphosphatase / guanosine-5'-triphosphate,3'-diphosphate pyrophosphatase
VPTGLPLTIPAVSAAVIDVGSNTIRLLVAAGDGPGLETILSERSHVGLASDIEREGRISAEKLARATELAAHYARLARESHADRLEVVITAPGRQSLNAEELRAGLADATAAPVRQLSAEEEGRLAYAGAVGACRAALSESIAVVDVGGGSTQLMVGTVEGPAWLRPLEVGSLRLTERFVRSNPPALDELDAVAAEVEQAFASLTPPLPLSALATGGTARALRRITGRRLGRRSLAAALDLLCTRSAEEIAADFGVPLERARVLAAGTIVLREAHRLLGVKLEVAKGGLREGAVRGLLAELAVEAA